MRPLALTLLSILFILPAIVLAQSGLVPCDGPECDICSFVQLADNLIDFLVYASTLIATIMFAYAGYELLTSGGNPSARSSAKSIIQNVLIGFVAILASWLIIDTVMKALFTDSELATDTTLVGTGKPWQDILCSFQSVVPEHLKFTFFGNPTNLPVGGGAVTLTWMSSGTGDCVASGAWTGVRPTSGSETVTVTASQTFSLSCPDAEGTLVSQSVSVTVASLYSGPGICEAPEDTANPCHPDNLTLHFGAANANQASQVCMVESGNGNIGAESGVDRLLSDGRKPFSIGLFQINLVANNLDTGECGNLMCSNAFEVDTTCADRLRSRDPEFCRASFPASLQSWCTSGGPNPESYCSVVKIDPASQLLYNNCVSRAKNAACNLSKASQLFRSAGGWSPWSYTARKCGF